MRAENLSLLPSLLKPALQSEAFKATFKKGAAAVLAIYLALFAYAAFTASSTQEKLQSQLAHETITIGESATKSEQTAQTADAHHGSPISADAHAQASHASQENAAHTSAQHNVTEKAGALTPAPIAAVSEETEHGLLPKIAGNRLTPFQAYKKPYPVAALHGPVIALGVSDFGLSHKNSASALQNLPAEVTLLISPYTPDLQHWIDNARASGFETWLNIPFETQAYPVQDTGSKTILKRSTLKLNMDRTLWALSQGAGYAGVYAQLDQTFTHSESMIKSLFTAIFMRGLGYMELDPTGNPYVENISVAQNAPYINTDLVFAPIDTPEAIDALIAQAKIGRTAIGVTSLTPNLVRELPSWIKKIKDHGITLVPLSAAYDYKWKT